MPHDKAYVYTLLAYANSNNIIDAEEVLVAKNNLDIYYSSKTEDKQNNKKNEYMFKLFKHIGFGATKVMWALINQFPSKIVGDINNAEFVPDNKSIMNKLKVDEVLYFKTINILVSLGFLSKRISKKVLIYKIDFVKIMRLEETI